MAKRALIFSILVLSIIISPIFLSAKAVNESEKNFIRWVDFNAPYEIMKKVYEYDKRYHDSETQFDFIEVLAYLATKNGNNFSYNKDNRNLNILIEKLEKKETTVREIYKDNKYFNYYLEAYSAIFSEFFGEDSNGNRCIKAYFPLAKGYWYNHYNDFGNKRSYGFKRSHLGHDIMGSIGTPIIAIEGGTVTELGWNQYGGWRIGIRSFDQKRYYYYAHLRKGKPFKEGLKLGDTVNAGDLIGYLGMTGYSKREDTNLKTAKPHLHLGLQLIFDKSQEDCNNEIWIDVYSICQFLSLNRKDLSKG